MPLNTKIALSVTADLSKALSLLPTEARVPLSKVYQAILGSGIIAGAADAVFLGTRTINGATNDDLDLAGGVLLDPLGTPLTFVKVKGLIISAAPANVNNCVVGAAAANPWVGFLGATHTITVRPGATEAMFAGQADAAGYAVVPATGDILRLANAAGAAINVDVIIIGTSA